MKTSTHPPQRMDFHRPQLRLAGLAKLLALLLLLAFSVVAQAQTTTGTTSDGFIYASSSGTVSITGYNGTGGAVAISGTINGLPVTGIGSLAFAGNTDLTSVTIPNTVTSIGDDAFNSCTGLTTVTIGTGVTSIGNTVFYYCPNLVKATFQGNAPVMGLAVFDYAASGFTVVYGNSATGFTLPTWYGYPAQTLTPFAPTITLNPASQWFLSGTTVALTAAALGSPNPTVQWQLSTTGTGGVFSNISSVGNPSATTGTLTLTNVTGTQNGYAYRAVFTNSVGSGTTAAATLTLSPFRFTTSNGQVTITGYSGTNGTVNIPGAINGMPVISIGDNAFADSLYPVSVTIPNSVTSIGTRAFYYCDHLANVTIGSGVTSIGGGAFTSKYGELNRFTVDPLNTVYSSSPDGVLFNKDQTTLLLYPPGGGSSYSIPNGVTTIGGGAFSNCTGLTRVTIPNSVTTIGSSAFYYCINLTSVTIPNGVTTIGGGAFARSGLSSVTIPASVTNIGGQAFASPPIYKGVGTVIFMGDAPSIGSVAFWAPNVYFFDGAKGFSSPTWNPSGDPYPYNTFNMGAPSPVTPWLVLKGLPCTSNPQSAPNGDGVSLLMSYALNLDPTRNQSRNIPRPVISGSNMSLTYYAGSAGITYRAETSTDLKNWDTTGVIVSGPDANNCYTATVPITVGTRRFMRLAVVQ